MRHEPVGVLLHQQKIYFLYGALACKGCAEISFSVWGIGLLCSTIRLKGVELKTEAENLLELRRKQGRSDKTLDDIIDKLDVAVSEIDIVPWPKDHIEQCEKDDTKMFDIPLVTSASHIVLQKLADSEKFKQSIPRGLLQKYKEATSIRGSNVGAPSGGRQLGDTTRDRRSQQQTSAAHEYSIVHEDHYTDDDSLLIERPADQQLESEADSLDASDSRIRKKSKLIFRSYIIVMLRRMLNCHLRTLSLLILDFNFNLALPLVHLHLTTNHLQALREWLQGHVRDPIMAGTLQLLDWVAGSSQGSIDVGQPSVYVICGGPSQGSYWADPYIYCPLNIEQVRRQEQEGLVIWSVEEEW
ncbi:hypothetical protein F4604DRAFT_1685085 [Suillus subluteus]|nr:hypothetical protein F4604DRAFT_1685085 [Suillus subluteus]